jgi:hypothetical protein
MNKQVELNLACYKLMQAIKNGNKILTNADYEKRWEAYKLRSLKLKNLRKKAQ